MSKRYNLKLFRMKQELTQEAMAKKLGISRSHYRSIELGVYDPSLKVIRRFSEVFKDDYIDIWELFG